MKWKFLIIIPLLFLAGCSQSLKLGDALRVLTAPQGGTGIGSATTSEIGYVPVVSSTNPFLFKLTPMTSGGSSTRTSTTNYFSFYDSPTTTTGTPNLIDNGIGVLFTSATGTQIFTTGQGIFGNSGGIEVYSMGSGVGTIGFNSLGYVAEVNGYGALMQLAPSTGAFTMFLESNVVAGAAHAHTQTLSWDNTGLVSLPVGLSTPTGTITTLNNTNHVFTNATGTNLNATNVTTAGLTFTNLNGTNATTTNLKVTTVTGGTWNGSVISEVYGGTNQSSYLLGDTLYASATNTLSKLPGNSSTVQLYLSQTGDGVNSGALSWQPIPSQSVLSYYFYDTLSNTSTYKKQQETATTTQVSVTSAGVVNAQVLQNWITDPGIPNLTTIPDGQYEFKVDAAQTLGVQLTQIRGEFWEVGANGVDIAMIGASATSTFLSGAQTTYTLFFNRTTPYALANTASRIVTRVRAIVTGIGTAPSVVLYYGGAADAHVELPGVTVDASNFLPYSGATADVNLGTHNLTLNGLTFTTITGTSVTSTNLAITGLFNFATGTIASSTITNLNVTNCVGCNGSGAPLTGNNTWTGTNNFTLTTTLATTTYTVMTGTSITSTNAFFTGLSFTNGNATNMTSTNEFITSLVATNITATNATTTNLAVQGANFTLNSAGNVSTSGTVRIYSTQSVGTCTLDGASPSKCTATVVAGCTPVCTFVSSTAFRQWGCAVAGTTLTAVTVNATVGTMSYMCF